MVLNLVEIFVPSADTAVIIVTAINAAISPYSIAVAPRSSRRKRCTVFISTAPSLPVTLYRIRG